MTELVFPTVTDDSGDKISGTIFDEQFFEDIQTAIEDNIHSLVNPTVAVKDIIDEVVAARGAESSLDDRLDDIESVIQAGGSSRRLHTNYTQAGSVGAVQTDLMTYSLPANSLDEAGRAIRVTAAGTLAGNANSKQIRFYFGGTTFIQTINTTEGSVAWFLEAMVVMTGASSQIVAAKAHTSGAELTGGVEAAGAESLAGDVELKVTGQGTDTDDVVINYLIVELL